MYKRIVSIGIGVVAILSVLCILISFPNKSKIIIKKKEKITKKYEFINHTHRKNILLYIEFIENDLFLYTNRIINDDNSYIKSRELYDKKAFFDKYIKEFSKKYAINDIIKLNQVVNDYFSLLEKFEEDKIPIEHLYSKQFFLHSYSQNLLVFLFNDEILYYLNDISLEEFKNYIYLRSFISKEKENLLFKILEKLDKAAQKNDIINYNLQKNKYKTIDKEVQIKNTSVHAFYLYRQVFLNYNNGNYNDYFINYQPEILKSIYTQALHYYKHYFKLVVLIENYEELLNIERILDISNENIDIITIEKNKAL